jgi:hypothetical protein
MAGYRETENTWEVRKDSLKSILRRFYFCAFTAIEFLNSQSPYDQPNARWRKYAATKCCSHSDLPERRFGGVCANSNEALPSSVDAGVTGPNGMLHVQEVGRNIASSQV